MEYTLHLVADSEKKALLYLADHTSIPGQILSFSKPKHAGVIIRYEVDADISLDLENWQREGYRNLQRNAKSMSGTLFSWERTLSTKITRTVKAREEVKKRKERYVRPGFRRVWGH